ncbi:macrolide ABC transporter ATP-binding protein [Candidatus Micrarchaeota archaeon CG1_02_47_40]|nr:MAG: macrolide ABC transporter ATP-binding protein [Candidatus Micrarchaeota archaeon CG1_02_47_40]
MSLQEEVLRLESVSKQYQMGSVLVKALDGISLRIKRGDYASVIGPSGSGKSTLLHIFGLLDEPTAGRVFIDGIDTTKLSEEKLAQVRGRKIGFVFQSFHLIPSLSAIENVALPAMLLGVPQKERLHKAGELLFQLGMDERASHLPKELSGGQRQRVAIARALINDPAILLADEPTGNLDSASGAEVLKIFDELHKDGRTIIVVTHDSHIASRCKKTIRIKDGRIESIKMNVK